MAVYSTTTKAGPFTADGAQTVFPFVFRCIDASDINVYRNGVLVRSTEYEVELTDDMSDGHYDGGNVVFITAPAKGEKLVILRNVPITQETDLQNNTAFYPEVLENAYDKLTMVCQQLAEKLSRAVIAPPGDGPTNDPGTDPDPGDGPTNDPDPGDGPTNDPGNDPNDLYAEFKAGLTFLKEVSNIVIENANVAKHWAEQAAASGGAPAYHIAYDVYGETQIVYPTIIDPGEDPVVKPLPQVGSKVTWTQVDMNGKPVYGDDHTTVESVRVIPGEVLSEGTPTIFTI